MCVSVCVHVCVRACVITENGSLNLVILYKQAEFREINLAAYTESGTVVDIQVMRNGTKVVR